MLHLHLIKKSQHYFGHHQFCIYVLKYQDGKKVEHIKTSTLPPLVQPPLKYNLCLSPLKEKPEFPFPRIIKHARIMRP
jgi:hypothetical protein